MGNCENCKCKTKKSIKQEFIKFLKEHKAVRKFYDNFKRSTTVSVKDPDCYILYAFVWSATPEGGKFWMDIHDLWQERLEEIR